MHRVLVLLLACTILPSSWADDPVPPRAFNFRTAGDGRGATFVPADAEYTEARGYGFEPGGKPDGTKPFVFSVKVPEGNYRVRVSLGDPERASDTTVKAELRRLAVERVALDKGGRADREFVVNVRRPGYPGGEVRLKDREKKEEWWNWDDKLTLEFLGPKPAVNEVKITRADTVPTVYLLGDSTVCDQPLEPYASWGQMLPRFFGPTVAVANHAESGESLRSSLSARRLDKVLSTLRKGDYLFLQFGHNDMKVVSAETYKADLKRFVTDARKREATVVLVTPVNRRTFQGSTVTNSLKDFPDAVRSLAREESCPLIDLHAMSKTLYEALGPEQSGVLFKPGDGTHHNNYGAYELAKCVVEGIRSAVPDLAKHLADDSGRFDPAKPDPAAGFTLPPSPRLAGSPPDGK
jgi:lysophospholipase L1-like esterase